MNDPTPYPTEEQRWLYRVAHTQIADNIAALEPGIGYDHTLEPGMILSVESYVGAVGGRGGVKLEQTVLLTEDGVEDLTSYPFDERLLG